MAQQVNVQISIEGERITPFSNITISQDIHRHHAFEIMLPTDAFAHTGMAMLQESKRYMGKECHIRFGAGIFTSRQSDNEFVGLVTEISLARHSNGERQIMLRGHSPTILMDGNPQSRSFTEMNVGEIAESMLEQIPHTLKSEISPITSKLIPYIVQYNESNYSFMQRIAAHYGEWCFYDGEQLIFGELPRGNVIELPLVQDLFNLEFTFKLLPVNFKAYAYNYAEHETYQSKASSITVNHLDEFGQFALDESARFYSQEASFATMHPVARQQELDDLVASRKSSYSRNMVMMSGNSDNPYLNVGKEINISGTLAQEQDYGRYIITSLSHSISGTYSYQNSFEAIPSELESPPSPPVAYPVGEPQVALVTDNKDPEKFGRIRVQFSWDNDNQTPWIRIVQPHAGKGTQGELHGTFFIPEIGDEVMVGFEDHHPDKPFVFGSVFHGKDAPTAWNNDGNTYKIIKTRNGNQIHLIDEGSKEKIRIFHTNSDDPVNEICLDMEAEGKITIMTKGTLDISAKNINITAEENIDVTAGKNFSLSTGENTDITASKNMRFTAGKEWSTKAQAMKATAAQKHETTTAELTVNASANVTLQAGANAKLVGGANTDVQGGAMASVQAPLVKIN